MASPQSWISNGNLADAEKLPTTFYLGLVVYLVSFFLPAVEQPSPMSGWMCAYLSLWAWLNKPLWMCFFAGIINPLAIAFVVLRHRNRAPKTRRVIALAVLACIPITWLFLSDMELGIRVGHVVWIAGLLLILFPARTLWPTVRDAPWLTVPPLLVLIWWGLRATTIYPLQPPTDRDIFIYEVAIQFKDPNLCQKIPPYAEGNGSGERPGYEISYLQSGCYFELAGALHDQSLCDKVKPISKGMRDGSKYTPESCREYRGYSGSGIVSPHTVTTWMRQLGYTDQDLHHFQYRAVFNNPMYEAYDRFRKDGQFSERLRAAPSFAEPVAVDKSRAPNDLE